METIGLIAIFALGAVVAYYLETFNQKWRP